MGNLAELDPPAGRLTLMAKIVSLAAMAAVALTMGCGTTAEGPTPGTTSPEGVTGVQGSAVVDEGCPVVVAGSQCPWRTLRARVIVLDRDGREVTRTDTGGTGRFRIMLSAGDYVLQGQNLTGGPLPVASPVPVTVHESGWTSVTIRFDSGVRGPAPS
jgi:hypothetical protein